MVLWRIILLSIFAITIRVQSQLDSNGFLLLDCGLPENSSFVGPNTNLTLVSDYPFIDTGYIANISSEHIANDTSRETLTLRYFPDGIRNCYTIRSLTIGLNYFLRAGFLYGNYDGKYNPPSFDLYIGVNFWYTVTLSQYDEDYADHIIVASTADYMEVCLINTGKGIPLISWLTLSQFKKGMYPYVNATQSLAYEYSDYLGTNREDVIRYPVDPYDRRWFTDPGPHNMSTENWSYYGLSGSFSLVSTNSTVTANAEFETPSLVMQTAIATSTTKEPIDLQLSSSYSTINYVILHFAEIQNTSKNVLREFSIQELTTKRLINESVVPNWLSTSSVSFSLTHSTEYNISLRATSNSTLPPLLNAVEQYTVKPFGFPTFPKDEIIGIRFNTNPLAPGLAHASDSLLLCKYYLLPVGNPTFCNLIVAAINNIKAYHKINKVGWRYDPCLPSNCVWSGIKCSNSNPNATDYTRITNISLSSSGLTGPLSDSFGNLSALVSLDLSLNDLSGSLPDSLDLLTNLVHLDIRGNNKLSTTLPTKLLRKYEDGKLSYRYSSPSSKNVVKIAIAVAVPVLVIAVAVAALLWLLRRKKDYGNTWKKEEWVELEGFSKLESRQFSHNDLKKITNGFKNIIGTGGFGSVYLGTIEDGTQVAVKMHSNSSSQGLKELFTEAESLTRVHHKNLVSLMGYCIDKTSMALVYEYMQEGNLHDKLKEKSLGWKQRLQIAYESAVGLEYLHEACNPPLIHRDVKTSNILLTANLEAKLADFGLSRTFNNRAISHVSTRIVGTPGYLDPEYYLSNGQLTVKSDVFSFGVVLLEIITGRPPITMDKEGGNLVQWVRQELSRGDIESIVDPRMLGEYDINSVWKVMNLACKCTELTSAERPTMIEVTAELKECLDLEIWTEEIHNKNMDNPISNLSQNSNFEIAYLGSMPTPSPSVR